MECDWIREFWVLGEKNSQLNAFWSFHIQELELYWEKLEEQTQFVISTLRKLFNEETFSTPRDEKLWNLISILENHLTERETLRVKWKKRYSAPAYQNLAQIWRPIQRPKIKYELKKIIKKELPLWKSKLINS